MPHLVEVRNAAPAGSRLLSLKHELRVMTAQKSGSIINISSTYGHQGAAGASVYVGSKHAVEGITKSSPSMAARLSADRALSPKPNQPRITRMKKDFADVVAKGPGFAHGWCSRLVNAV